MGNELANVKARSLNLGYLLAEPELNHRSGVIGW
jgi:hypothetical protein